MKISPNHISGLRAFFFGPLACVFLMYDRPKLALAAMFMGELTDFADGWWARRTGQVTPIGKIFDPLCDSVYHMVVWMSLLKIGWAPIYLVILFFVRDSSVSTIRTYLASNGGGVLAARRSGKVKMVVQAVAQFALVVSHGSIIGLAAAWVAALITCYSLFDYTKPLREVLRKKGQLADKA